MEGATIVFWGMVLVSERIDMLSGSGRRRLIETSERVAFTSRWEAGTSYRQHASMA